MLSLPDFREKQILFITTEKDVETKIQFWNDNLRLLKNGEPVNQLSCHKIFAVFIMGDLSITSILIKNCAKYGIGLFLLKNNFELYSAICQPASGNYILRMKQYSLGNELYIAKMLVKNKMSNQILLLKERDVGSDSQKKLLDLMDSVDSVTESEGLLGLEGSSTRIFFSLYFSSLGWKKRTPRAKIDYLNTLMDIGYTFLFNFVDSLLQLYGFDTYKGVYHKLFFQRKSLACDIVEPFRCIVDRQILKSHNLKQINEKDFKKSNGQSLLGYEKQKKYAEIFLSCIMDRKEDIFCYVRDYYYYVLNGDKELPFFKIVT